MLPARRVRPARVASRLAANRSTTTTTTMRIHIHIPVRAAGQTRATVAGTSVPEQLAQLSPAGEPVLVEIQGSLDVDLQGQELAYDDDAPGQRAPAHILGSLSWEAGFSVRVFPPPECVLLALLTTTKKKHKKTKKKKQTNTHSAQEHPVLTISRHKLQGRVVSLQKPLAVLQKKRRSAGRAPLDVPPSAAKRPRTSSPPLPGQPLGSDEHALRTDASQAGTGVGSLDPEQPAAEEEDDETREMLASSPPQSPTPASARPHKARPGSCSPKHRTPAPPPSGGRSENPYSDAMDFSSSPVRMPATTKPAHGATDQPTPAPDFSDRERDRDPSDSSTEESLSATPTYYDVVAVIRKKIVFSKRPEPIVH